MNVVFAGTPDFAVPALRALLGSKHPVVGVYTQPDRPAGRGRALTASPVKIVAVNAGVPVFQPPSLKNNAAQAALAALEPDVMVVVAYGLILPQAVLDIPTHGCINIHASLLPRWRGAAPIQRAIEAGDADTGVCFMQMDAGLDTGPVLARAATSLEPDETAATLHDRLAALGGEYLVGTLNQRAAGTIAAEPQNNASATYAHKLSKPEAEIDWTQSAQSISRRIRAFNPWPVAHTALDGQTIRVFGAQAVDQSVTEPPGTVLARPHEDRIMVATGDGVLAITELQWPGKRRMSAADALAGRDLAGQRFEPAA